MVQVLEWFQCKGCGRRHRWRAEIAGTEIPCPCGKSVFCPELDVFGDSPGAGDTLLDPSGSLAKNRRLTDSAAGDHFPAETETELVLEGAQAAPPVAFTKVKGLFGMSRFGEFVFWGLAAAVGFTLCVFAAVVWSPYYAVPAGIWGPFSFWKAARAKRRWQGHRTFSRAVRETLE